jgi:CP family cyanate transporter-like MFS transporter
VWLTLLLCWVVGINLRTVILGVPPVLPLIQHDLRLSNTLIGLLSSLPVLCMGVLAIPAARLAARLGGRVAVALGLGLLAAGAFLRAVPATALAVFGFTLVLSIGITIAQTTLPVLVRQWFPERIGLASAVYSNGLVIGETLAVAVTGPVFLRGFGADAWPATFLLWSLPVALVLGCWLVFAPPAPPLGFAAAPTASASAPGEIPATGVRAETPLPAWHLGLLLGSGSLIYFGMNAWIPLFDQAVGRAGTTAVTLAALNAAQLPMSLVLTVAARRLIGRRWPFVTAGVLVLLALGAWLWAPAASGPVWAGLLGAASSFVFVIGLALPPLVAGKEHVARLTGATLSIGYTTAFVGPLLGGGLWDLVHRQPAIVFAPVACAALLLIVLGSTLPAVRLHNASAMATSTD